MSYTVLARKYRPKNFSDLTGQGSIVRILKNAVSEQRIAHAYLFSGPRGVGKTTSARILARAVNCTNGPTPDPCGECLNCKASLDGVSIDIIEIDGASNNSVDDIRDLRERVKYAPSSSRYKVYIIDEAHMLSASAFNALLKTLEEPPAHVIFILATTVPGKILTTVLSRCQHLPFKRITSGDIAKRLKEITAIEGIRVTDGALGMIARAADGSMRDSLTLLDQIASYSTDIDEAVVRDMLGTPDETAVCEMAERLITGDRKGIIELIDRLYETGTDLRNFLIDLTGFVRDALVSSITGERDSSNVTGTEVIERLVSLSDEQTLTILLNELIASEITLKNAVSSRTALEMSLVRMSFIGEIKPIRETLEELRRMSRGMPASQARPVETGGVKEPVRAAPVTEGVELSAPKPPVQPPQPTMPEPEPVVKKQPITFRGDDVDRIWQQALKEIESTDHILFFKLGEV